MNVKTLTNPLYGLYIYAAIAAGAALLFVLSGAFTAEAQMYTNGQASSNFALSGNLTVGSRGNAVSELQRFLATDPTIYPEGLVTGYYGSLTAAAVERFQCRHDIVCSGSAATNGYGRVGPLTLAKLIRTSGLTGVGGSDTSDVHAPILANAFISTSTNTAAISWVTNEPVRSRVMYSTVFPFLYSTAPSVADATPFDSNLTQTVSLSNLLPNTSYFYVIESVDLNGNVQMTTAHSFRTGA